MNLALTWPPTWGCAALIRVAREGSPFGLSAAGLMALDTVTATSSPVRSRPGSGTASSPQ